MSLRNEKIAQNQPPQKKIPSHSPRFYRPISPTTLLFNAYFCPETAVFYAAVFLADAYGNHALQPQT